jgi:hypothetical protein
MKKYCEIVVKIVILSDRPKPDDEYEEMLTNEVGGHLRAIEKNLFALPDTSIGSTFVSLE